MGGSVESARRHLGRLRVALTSASLREMEQAVPELEQAMVSLRELEARLGSGEAPEAGLTLALLALARETQLAQRLADRGRDLCQGRAMALAAAAGGYSASGKPAPLGPVSTIRIEG